MSWYVNYYVCYQTPDKKIYPLGPFDCNGRFYPAIWKSHSFSSDLHEIFVKFEEENWTKELMNALYSDCEAAGDETIDWRKECIYYLPLEDLPKGDFVKKGYFLTCDIDNYEKTGESEDLLLDYLTSDEYARKLITEKIGKPTPRYDIEGNEFEHHSAADYSYYSYVDMCSKEYEAYMIREIAGIFEFTKLPEGAKIVIVDSEG